NEMGYSHAEIDAKLKEAFDGLFTFTPDPFGGQFTDPSYHIPVFYEIWAKYADDGRSQFSPTLKVAISSTVCGTPAMSPTTMAISMPTTMDSSVFLHSCTSAGVIA
ncbi:MAG: hypothetical protein ACI3ZD_00370, partial [Prevotella sp.]